MSPFADQKRRLRARSEHVLRMAAMDDVARRYPTRTVPSAIEDEGPFWRLVFVPLYRRVPWEFKRKRDAQAEDDRAGLARAVAAVRRAVAPAGVAAAPGDRDRTVKRRGRLTAWEETRTYSDFLPKPRRLLLPILAVPVAIRPLEPVFERSQRPGNLVEPVLRVLDEFPDLVYLVGRGLALVSHAPYPDARR